MFSLATSVPLLTLQLAPEVSVVEPTLMVVGLNHRTAPLAMRERFWIGEKRRYDVLRQLKCAEGIDEAIVLSTCCRTEFILWASEPTVAANSLLQFLSSEYGLKLTEWERFCRLLDETALTHVFRVACGLESLVLGEPHIVSQLKAAWEQSRTVGACSRFLGSVMEKALSVSKEVRSKTGLAGVTVSIPAAALDLARQIFESLEGRRVLLLGSDKMTELSGRLLKESGAASVVVIDQSPARATELAESLGGTVATLADRWQSMVRADIVITATGCPHVILTREEAERIAQERNRVALVILDIGMPRNVDAGVHRVDGILLYDLEGLQRLLSDRAENEKAITDEADRIVAQEAATFRNRLQAESVVPTIVAIRRRLDEICRQELDSFIEERGPFTREQDQSLHAVTTQIIQKIASSLARELKELPEREEQEQMTAVVNRLFHLEPPKSALAGATSEKRKNEQPPQSPVAINY
ncbi:MAG TPA: glutamyl-tRNA reductase [Candidatus Sulfotelmatobacter sp.]|nr:glutamyl-tRNA reductase [Candidatus Sulfotelmatobacter sp.]